MATPNQIIVNVKDYSLSPGPRYTTQGDFSGEDFYHKVLNPQFAEAYNSQQILCVNLDGVDGYMSSFLDEAFGNLIYDFGKSAVEPILNIISDEEPEWISMITGETFKEWEKRRNNKERPKKTTEHCDWKGLENGALVNLNSKK